MKPMRPGIGILCFVLFASCAVGPKYKVPTAPSTPNFKEPPPAGWKEAQPQDDTIRGKWWEMFGDSQLNGLEEQVNISNQTVAAAEANFREARAAITVARAALYPTITVGGNANKSQSSGRSVSTNGTNIGGGTFFQLPIDFNYELDVWGRVRNNIKASVANAEATSADVETARLSTTAELAYDYFELRGLDEQTRLLQESVTSYERALQLTTDRYQQGIASQVDVSQARAQLDTTRAALTDVGVTRSQLEHAIALLVGKPPADLTIPASPIDKSDPPTVPVALPSELLERRPDVAAAERRVASANATIGVAEAAYFPTIAISATAGLENTSFSRLLQWPSRFWSLGTSVTELAFDGFQRHGVTKEAEANYDVTVANYRQSVLSAFVDVEDNLAALRILAVEIQQEAVAIESSQRLLDLTMTRYRNGIAGYLDVITAQNTLLTNQRTGASIQARRAEATVLLIKALGGGWNRSQITH
jgi:NodT family efflux transporter outer membrane factor (OMF) lipoprotein